MPKPTLSRQALLIGATGRVGEALVRKLAAMYDTLIIVARRPPNVFGSNMQLFTLTDFANLAHTIEMIPLAKDCDVFCCLWHAMQHKDETDKIYYDYPLALAQACRHKGVQRFFLLSTHKANPKSTHPQKALSGKLEDAISKLGFETLLSFRPDVITPAKLDFGTVSLDTLHQNARHLLATAFLQKTALSPDDIAHVMAQTAYHSADDPRYLATLTKVRFWHKKPSIHLITHKHMLAIAQDQDPKPQSTKPSLDRA